MRKYYVMKLRKCLCERVLYAEITYVNSCVCVRVFRISTEKPLKCRVPMRDSRSLLSKHREMHKDAELAWVPTLSAIYKRQFVLVISIFAHYKKRSKENITQPLYSLLASIIGTKNCI